MFARENRYLTSGIDQRIPQELQLQIWACIDTRLMLTKGKIDYLQLFTLEKVGDSMLAIHHEQERPKMTNIYYINYRQEYKDILQEKIFVIDDGDHSTMLFAYEY